MDNATIEREIIEAKQAHRAWRKRLEIAVSIGTLDTRPEDIERTDLCKFGKWLRSATMTDEVRAGKPYQVISRLHADFHKCTARVARLIENNHRREAQDILDGDFTLISEKLERALNKWLGELRAEAN